ncbi:MULTISPECIES: hypothetical protein [unclassified Coleofasciculus]|nr:MULTISPECIES: hypothetical protein [unclassified Coleofasciculus]MBE9124802.1 hypothetical protein [Coleofasciculus sp. LEGE 07081]MBE9147707.1 hypothetical protein [Coleofasciculus sp. LEGE 07092]
MLERLLLAIAVTFSVYISVESGFYKTPMSSVLQQLPATPERSLGQ